MTDLREISRDVIRHKISTSLRARIGHGSKYSVAQVAAQTGISSSTLKGYLGGLAEPSLSQFIKLAAALGLRGGGEREFCERKERPPAGESFGGCGDRQAPCIPATRALG